MTDREPGEHDADSDPPHRGGRHAAREDDAVARPDDVTTEPDDLGPDPADHEDTVPGRHANTEEEDVDTSPESSPPADADAAPPTGFAAYRARRRDRKAARAKRMAPWWELPALIVLAIVIAIVVKSFVIQPFYIPSESMENTLKGSASKGHDRILVFKPIYDFRDPEPGDIVVFHLPKYWDSSEGITKPPGNPVVRVVRGFGQLIGFVPPDGQVLVKRVIAVGGQTVKGDAQGHVMISTHGAGGPYRTLDEPYILDDPGSTQEPFGPITVPSGRLWVMGDHRTDSADSRFHCVKGREAQASDGQSCDAVASTVPIGDVIGKAIVVAWPPSHWRTLGTPTTFENASAAAAPMLPGAAAGAVVVPLFLLRRRRRLPS